MAAAAKTMAATPNQTAEIRVALRTTEIVFTATHTLRFQLARPRRCSNRHAAKLFLRCASLPPQITLGEANKFGQQSLLIT